MIKPTLRERMALEAYRFEQASSRPAAPFSARITTDRAWQRLREKFPHAARIKEIEDMAVRMSQVDWNDEIAVGRIESDLIDLSGKYPHHAMGLGEAFAPPARLLRPMRVDAIDFDSDGKPISQSLYRACVRHIRRWSGLYLR